MSILSFSFALVSIVQEHPKRYTNNLIFVTCNLFTVLFTSLEVVKVTNEDTIFFDSRLSVLQ